MASPPEPDRLAVLKALRKNPKCHEVAREPHARNGLYGSNDTLRIGGSATWS
jgi:hypothetical protein